MASFMEITNVTAFPLKKARGILKSEGYAVEIKISGMNDIYKEESLRVARQTLKNSNTVEVVAVQSKDYKV
ncbi:MAG: hypothetical protein D5R97_05455 [Candidatus Syntrophonatronum acetioxidans]|uniref:PASTA domain-containing protein n=1 Tax=Candidatus Syntrophonatronum acetioxidans TaxID=1795816 RepID=A0A424YEC5_9FIRM|nr:MAG: hypothetical protein D5R97_05455 [Candidatus Syntrophonatronum acetioxidans]